MFSNLCSRAWICCGLRSLSVCLGVSDAVRCTVRARKWPFIMTCSDFTVLSTSFLCERNKRCHILQSQKGKTDLSGVGFCVLPRLLVHLDQLQSASSTEFHLNWMMTLNPHFNAPEQQQQQHRYSGSVPVEYFRPSVSPFVDDEKNI